jgi:starvation-inducible outer membrane lipoprotein
MEFSMKHLLAIPLMLVLCACSSAPVSLTSSSDPSAALSFGDSLPEAMHHRSFYEDRGDTPQWMKVAPRTNE